MAGTGVPERESVYLASCLLEALSCGHVRSGHVPINIQGSSMKYWEMIQGYPRICSAIHSSGILFELISIGYSDC